MRRISNCRNFTWSAISMGRWVFPNDRAEFDAGKYTTCHEELTILLFHSVFSSLRLSSLSAGCQNLDLANPNRLDFSVWALSGFMFLSCESKRTGNRARTLVVGRLSKGVAAGGRRYRSCRGRTFTSLSPTRLMEEPTLTMLFTLLVKCYLVEKFSRGTVRQALLPHPSISFPHQVRTIRAAVKRGWKF